LTSTAWWSETQLALRRVFALDADFKESMFARQMAVMKGQAWNVVETLKQEDHGPLELTRRARVCVWDDLVDVPVAIPMRMPPKEMSRQTEAAPYFDQQEEMDIGASYSSAPPGRQPSHDLLGSPTGELPNPNRFDLTSQDGADLSYLHDGNEGFVNTAFDPATDIAREARNSLGNSPFPSMANTRPDINSRGGTKRLSFEFPRRADPSTSKSTPSRRQRSFSTRSGKQPAPPILYEGDDLEGDLGYAAASDMERNKRKVIVERLETVKSKKPVFTWC
jgi:hypothetical protein